MGNIRRWLVLPSSSQVRPEEQFFLKFFREKLVRDAAAGPTTGGTKADNASSAGDLFEDVDAFADDIAEKFMAHHARSSGGGGADPDDDPDFFSDGESGGDDDDDGDFADADGGDESDASGGGGSGDDEEEDEDDDDDDDDDRDGDDDSAQRASKGRKKSFASVRGWWMSGLPARMSRVWSARFRALLACCPV
jgi:hypothetical protein